MNAKTIRDKRTRARRRTKARVLCAIDYETRGAGDMELGRRVHYEIARLRTEMMQHVRPDPQTMAYAASAGLDEVVVIHGGDFVTGEVHPSGTDYYNEEYYHKIDVIMREYARLINEAMSSKI